MASAASAVIALAFRTCLTVDIVGNVSGTQIENTTTIASHTYTAPIRLKARPRRRRSASDGPGAGFGGAGRAGASAGADCSTSFVGLGVTVCTSVSLYRVHQCVFCESFTAELGADLSVAEHDNPGAHRQQVTEIR